jgi:hypothetical protein
MGASVKTGWPKCHGGQRAGWTGAGVGGGVRLYIGRRGRGGGGVCVYGGWRMQR